MSKDEDFEDGELPEDGEICDDEEEVVKPSSSEPPKISPAAPAASSSSSETRGERRRFESPHPRDRDPDPFGSHNEAPDEYGDKDYRSAAGSASANPEEDAPFTDTDYRVNHRRRRLSPSHHDDSDYDSRSKRPYFGGRGGFRGGFRNGPKPRFQTEHQICKFFREGYCRDGDNCLYSHQAEDSLRRPVLCNFYANSFCKKGLQCLMLHGEFPCKEFHKGQCQSEQCRYSHVPLTDYTRPIIDKILADEEARQPHQPPQYRQNPVANAAAAAAAATVLQPRRRVLLPGGPAPNGTSPPHSTPVIHAPVPQPSHLNGGALPPPAVVVPIIQRNPVPSNGPMYPPPGGYFNSMPANRPEQVQGLPPPRTIEPPRPSHIQRAQHPPLVERNEPSPPAFNLEAMLNKLANGDKLKDMQVRSTPANIFDDSPASPPPANQFKNIFGGKVAVIPQTIQVAWCTIRVQKKLAYSNVENPDRIPNNDPRRAKAISKQFDAFSTLLSAGGSVVSDPRLRAQKEKTDSARQQTSSMFSSWMPQIS